ncbi:MAG: sugar transferase [Cytophagales bacterium]|nr:sugar transferase [Cytophagales bacterium]
MIYFDHFKKYLDIFFAWILVLILIPVFVLVCLCLFMTQGANILFIQERSGKDLAKFRLIKFRTLQSSVSSGLSMDNRKFTSLGKFLRRTGLDELPQLINIAKGEMSFIGPRPMPVDYVGRYNKLQMERFNVMPGITGWAQINGRNNVSWVERFEMDRWYTENISLMLDVRILVCTIFQIMVSFVSPGKKDREMPVFNGSN